MSERPTPEQLAEMYVDWSKTQPQHLRFGQYVFNEIGFETDASYHLRDPQEAFRSLMNDPQKNVTWL